MNSIILGNEESRMALERMRDARLGGAREGGRGAAYYEARRREESRSIAKRRRLYSKDIYP